jgi:hypothetical protein
MDRAYWKWAPIGKNGRPFVKTGIGWWKQTLVGENGLQLVKTGFG